jgi:hypothetical protein
VDPTCGIDCFTPAEGMKDISLVLDGVMETIKRHLYEEFQQQRLRGSDYAKVYVGTTEAVLANTTQYLVGMALINEQRQKILADVSLTHKQMEKVDKEMELMDKQMDKIDSEILLIDAQTRQVNADIDQKLPKELALMDAQLIKLTAETEHVRETTKQTVAETSLIHSKTLSEDYQRKYVMPQEVLKLQADTLLVGEQTYLTRAQQYLTDSQAVLTYAKVETEKLQPQLVDSQIRLSDAQVLLAEAKVKTEALQPGLVNAQIALYGAQKKGFEQKPLEAALKACTDAFAVSKTQDEDWDIPLGIDGISTSVYTTLLTGYNPHDDAGRPKTPTKTPTQP